MTSFSTSNLVTSPQQNPGNNPLVMGPAPVFRNAKDARLASWGASPDTNFPDGYLGTLHGRRDDKMLNAITRQNYKAYSRGVHKGERINPGDYIFPEEFGMWTGIQRQMSAKRVDL